MEIQLSYPVWFLILCVLLGVAYALVLYARSRKNNLNHITRWGLGILRTATVTLIAFLLLAPFIKSLISELEKPIIVLAHDNSSSIRYHFNKNDSIDYLQQQAYFVQKLREKYDVISYGLGENAQKNKSFQFEDPVTNLSKSLNTILKEQEGLNLAGIVLASDGNYNRGINPLYIQNKAGVPIHAIALGDTTVQRDAAIQNVVHNSVVYLEDQFGLKIHTLFKKLQGSMASLVVRRVTKGSIQKVFEKEININNKIQANELEVILKADAVGVNHYQIEIKELPEESTIANNTQNIYVNVLDSKQKILILYHSPHPDISALKQSIESNKNYQVTTSYLDRFKGNIKEYNLIVLHQLPAKKENGIKLIQEVSKQKIPVLFIVSALTDMSVLNQVQQVCAVQLKRGTNEVFPYVNASFSDFNIDETTRQAIFNLPPLLVPFGEYTTLAGTRQLINQKIGSVETNYPLIAFAQVAGNRQGLIMGEGIWKWRLNIYLKQQSHQIFDDLINKVVQYLANKEDKRKFRVETNKREYDENEAIQLDGELYNDNYELTNRPEVNVKVINQAGKEYRYVLNRTSQRYQLNLGYLEAGIYNYTATTNWNQEKRSVSGKFTVQSIHLEDLTTEANHQVLYALSQKFGGSFHFPNTMEKLADDLLNQETSKPIVHTSFETKSILEQVWLLFLITGLLVLEWFIRKWQGSY